MFNMDKEFKSFEAEYVKLTTDQREALRGYRDSNLERINNGLSDLGHPRPFATYDQGSYDTRTTVQQPNNDYDIDTALIFDSGDLPSDSEKARERIKAALDKAGGNFKNPPTVRTNAVTVWYQDGHHVDMAVYKHDDLTGQVLHASSDWKLQGVKDVSEWFERKVSQLSPGGTPSMKGGQLRRIVRLLKMFGKTRSSWNMPGGLINSVLTAESYVPDSIRDDVAFVMTLRKIHSRLLASTDIYHPTQPSRLLTEKQKYMTQVLELREKLGEHLRALEKLDDASCTKAEAVRAWKTFFKHPYWDELEDKVSKALEEGARINSARSSGALGVAKDGHLTTDYSGSAVRKHQFYGEKKKSKAP